MKEINYDKRAEWNEFISEDSLFIKNIIHQLVAKTILEIPCSNGRNLDVIGMNSVSAIFGDINKKMVDVVKDKINSGRYYNCSAMVLDLCDLSALSKYRHVDLILIMQQAFQMLNFEQAQKSFENLRKCGARYIVIDIYDFLAGATDLPLYLTQDKYFLDERGLGCIRKSALKIGEDDSVWIRHDYIAQDANYTISLKLKNYSRKDFILFCKHHGFIIVDVFTNYDMTFQNTQGRTIVLLMNKL